jgi:hypothetical protein
MEIRERSPPISKTSMVGPLGGDAGGLGAPSTYLEYIDGGPPWEAMTEVQERSPPVLKMSMAEPLGGDDGHSVVPTTYPKDFDGGPPGKQ